MLACPSSNFTSCSNYLDPGKQTKHTTPNPGVAEIECVGSKAAPNSLCQHQGTTLGSSIEARFAPISVHPRNDVPSRSRSSSDTDSDWYMDHVSEAPPPRQFSINRRHRFGATASLTSPHHTAHPMDPLVLPAITQPSDDQSGSLPTFSELESSILQGKSLDRQDETTSPPGEQRATDISVRQHLAFPDPGQPSRSLSQTLAQRHPQVSSQSVKDKCSPTPAHRHIGAATYPARLHPNMQPFPPLASPVHSSGQGYPYTLGPPTMMYTQSGSPRNLTRSPTPSKKEPVLRRSQAAPYAPPLTHNARPLFSPAPAKMKKSLKESHANRFFATSKHAVAPPQSADSPSFNIAEWPPSLPAPYPPFRNGRGAEEPSSYFPPPPIPPPQEIPTSSSTPLVERSSEFGPHLGGAFPTEHHENVAATQPNAWTFLPPGTGSVPEQSPFHNYFFNGPAPPEPQGGPSGSSRAEERRGAKRKEPDGGFVERDEAQADKRAKELSTNPKAIVSRNGRKKTKTRNELFNALLKLPPDTNSTKTYAGVVGLIQNQHTMYLLAKDEIRNAHNTVNVFKTEMQNLYDRLAWQDTVIECQDRLIVDLKDGNLRKGGRIRRRSRSVSW
ncbi:hypothetical protein OF83DRAFT_1127881 [Amylostereum chailletii]|nr:hypothetical protein OF83DRAFT_1127881 [Amylostereum chailletii]